jgi:hypothetical protein
MTILLLVLGIILLIGGVVLYHYGPDADQYDSCSQLIGGCIGVLGGTTILCALTAIIVLGVKVSNLEVIDDKIAMYQEENTKIEEQIVTAVEGYQKYETDIFKNAKTDSAIALVSLYPELKSDTLVQKQIEVYVSNNKNITYLKEQQIQGDVYRWWLYFGGK